MSWYPPPKAFRVDGNNELIVAVLVDTDATSSRRGAVAVAGHYEWPDGTRQRVYENRWPKDISPTPKKAIERRAYVLKCAAKRFREAAQISAKKAQISTAKAQKLDAAAQYLEDAITRWEDDAA